MAPPLIAADHVVGEWDPDLGGWWARDWTPGPAGTAGLTRRPVAGQPATEVGVPLADHVVSGDQGRGHQSSPSSTGANASWSTWRCCCTARLRRFRVAASSATPAGGKHSWRPA